jgi:hypothetical protein
MVLLPREGGLSAGPAPIVSWFLSRAFDGRVEIRLAASNNSIPIFREVVRRRMKPGIYHVTLAESDKRLAPEVNYTFKVTLVRDPSNHSRNVISAGTLQYLPHEPFAQLLEENNLVAAAAWVRRHGI